MSKTEIKRTIKELKNEYNMIDEMIELSGGHGWGDCIEKLRNDQEEIINKINNLKQKL